MEDNVRKSCVSWNTEKRIEILSRRKSKCKSCNIKKVLKRH